MQSLTNRLIQVPDSVRHNCWDRFVSREKCAIFIAVYTDILGIIVVPVGIILGCYSLGMGIGGGVCALVAIVMGLKATVVVAITSILLRSCWPLILIPVEFVAWILYWLPYAAKPYGRIVSDAAIRKHPLYSAQIKASRRRS